MNAALGSSNQHKAQSQFPLPGWSVLAALLLQPNPEVSTQAALGIRQQVGLREWFCIMGGRNSPGDSFPPHARIRTKERDGDKMVMQEDDACSRLVQ